MCPDTLDTIPLSPAHVGSRWRACAHGCPCKRCGRRVGRPQACLPVMRSGRHCHPIDNNVAVQTRHMCLQLHPPVPLACTRPGWLQGGCSMMVPYHAYVVWMPHVGVPVHCVHGFAARCVANQPYSGTAVTTASMYTCTGRWWLAIIHEGGSPNSNRRRHGRTIHLNGCTTCC